MNREELQAVDGQNGVQVVGPFMLNPDCYLQIFKLLTLPDLVNLSRTCKYFDEFLRKEKETVFRQFKEFKVSTDENTINQICSSFQYAGQYLQKITFDNSTNHHITYVAKGLKRRVRLIELVIQKYGEYIRGLNIIYMRSHSQGFSSFCPNSTHLRVEGDLRMIFVSN